MTIKEYFDNKFEQALSIVRRYDLDFYKFGIFGSYSRGDYDASSDIDIVIIFNELPPRRITANLRCDLDDLNVDLAVLLKSSFDNPSSAFTKSVVRDFREINLYERN